MLQEALIMAFGSAVSFAFRFIPALATKYYALEKGAKQLVMALVLLGVSGLIFGANCVGLGVPESLAISCTKDGALELLGVFALLVLGNQATYPLIEE